MRDLTDLGEEFKEPGPDFQVSHGESKGLDSSAISQLSGDDEPFGPERLEMLLGSMFIQDSPVQIMNKIMEYQGIDGHE